MKSRVWLTIYGEKRETIYPCGIIDREGNWKRRRLKEAAHMMGYVDLLTRPSMEIEKPGIADHIWREKGNYLPLWDNVEIIDREGNWKRRRLKEAAHMMGYVDLLTRPSMEIEKPGMADHIWREKGNHLLLWDNVEIIDREGNWKRRRLKEAAHMMGYVDLLTRPSMEIEKSGMADHIWREKGTHLPLWDNVEIIDREGNWKRRRLKEAAHILS